MRVLKTNLSAEKTMKASGTPRIIKLLTLAMKLTTGEEELINCRIGEAKTNPTIIEIHTPAKINNNKAPIITTNGLKKPTILAAPILIFRSRSIFGPAALKDFFRYPQSFRDIISKLKLNLKKNC
ncbi:MAG: hypothetical protein IPP89_12510 [Saprospiraceae bacterium]|nr:hypothetical protein [Candidatus Brachybacter algidus]MBL0119774.1 hypothetical protein [Candidatus Brachybacter algidus]